MNKTVFILFYIFFSLWTFSAIGQNTEWTISGIVEEEAGKQPVPYATVAVIKNGSDKILTGVTTRMDGDFSVSVASENVYIEISFLGYNKKTITDIHFVNHKANLGKILLTQSAQSLNEVEVTAEKSRTEFKLDKRIFNVGKDISSTGMSALEVLNNVPSVNVTIEGEISLRGNTGVQILINGKPSVLADDPGNALGTITADMIERIEVITNPSAKYSAEGSSGILNIVLKKEEKKGLNGSVSVNTGIPANHSIGISLNKRTESFNFFTQMGVGYRSLPRHNESKNYDKINGSSVWSEGTSYRNENFYNITLGTDYHINDYNVVTLSGNFAYELEDQPSETNYTQLDEGGVAISLWKREETTQATNPKWQYDLQYTLQFKDDKEHKLQLNTLGSFFGKDLNSDFVNTTILGSDENTYQRTRTKFDQSNYTLKLDYTQPLNDKFTIEAGGQYDINDVGNDYQVSNLIGPEYVPDTSLTNNFKYNQGVLGLYSTGSYEGEKWGLKVGLRLEHTDLSTFLTTTGQANNQDYTNFFPSIHTSYKVSNRASFQAGYSRRIYRPRLWDLNPFFNITDNYNIRRGNPELQPEYADSYELTGIFTVEKLSLNSSIYNLYTTDVIERVSFAEKNRSVTMPLNIGTNNTTGFELNAKYSPAKWFTLNGDFNLGFFSRKGDYESQNFDFNGNKYNAKLNTKFQLSNGVDLELTGNYQSKFKTFQGNVSASAFMDAGVRKKLWNGKGVINLSVRDIFASRIRENIVDQPNYYLFSRSKRGTFITLGFSYGFGKGEAMTYSGRRH